MSEHKHTAGPWGFGRTRDDQRLILGKNGDGRYVCNVQIHQTPRAMGYMSEPEREANAQLICAAPDMLRVLQQLQSVYQRGIIGCADGEWSAAHDAVACVIAKATGATDE